MLGVVMPSAVIARALFGRSGLLLTFVMYDFLIANISIFQLFSITSILTYDIYATHIRVNILALTDSISSILTTTLGPLVYTFFWDGMTSNGIVIGTLLSTSLIAFIWHMLHFLGGIAVDGDLSDVILYVIAIILGFVLPPLVVFIEKIWNRIHHKTWLSPLHSSWARVYEMDNPLDPCAFDYAKSFSLANFDMQSYNQPSFQEVKRAYRSAWYFALAGPFLFCFLFVGVMPMMFAIVDIMDLVTFKAWIYVILVLLVLSTAVTIFLPIVFEAGNCLRLIRAERLPRDLQHILPRIEYSEHQDAIEME
nr:hypothetical protein HmN_000494700 [Hymenolepis microstoma]